MNSHFIEIDGADLLMLPYEVNPVKGYKQPVNFPKCCAFHTHVYENGEAFFLKFPNCCDGHKKMTRFNDFNKNIYAGLAIKIVSQLSYTEHLIVAHSNQDDWFDDFVDYFEYNSMSFGHPEVGKHLYLHHLRHYINVSEEEKLVKEHRKLLLDFLDNHSKPKKSISKSNFSLLFETYQKWLKSFPFKIDHFKNAREYYQKTLPIISGKPRINRYSGVAKANMLSKEELISNLIGTTKNLLKTIQSSEFLDKDKLLETQYQLISEAHKLEQIKLLEDFTSNESKYLSIIKKWLSNERKYLKEITPIIYLVTMAKNYDLEVKEVFEKPYLKVFLKDQSRLQEISQILSGLSSVKRANISESNKGKNLTIYPSRVHDIKEVRDEITFTLDNYFNGNIADPMFTDEIISSISSAAYIQIIQRILIFGKNLEHFKDLYSHMGEENFRNFFLPHLNAISNNHSSTGETFNKIGKTDILVQDRAGNNVFIGECKLWKGKSELNAAIDQLLTRYVAWRDEKTALIIFNKDVAGFTEVIDKAIETLKEHSQFKTYNGNRMDTAYSFVFKHPEDPLKTVSVELILFNCK